MFHWDVYEEAKKVFSGEQGRCFNELHAQPGRKNSGYSVPRNHHVTKLSSWMINKRIDMKGHLSLVKRLLSLRGPTQQHLPGSREVTASTGSGLRLV